MLLDMSSVFDRVMHCGHVWFFLFYWCYAYLYTNLNSPINNMIQGCQPHTFDNCTRHSVQLKYYLSFSCLHSGFDQLKESTNRKLTITFPHQFFFTSINSPSVLTSFQSLFQPGIFWIWEKTIIQPFYSYEDLIIAYFNDTLYVYMFYSVSESFFSSKSSKYHNF